MEILQAQSADEISSARRLFEEYGSWLKLNFCFQNFDRELAGLPGEYSPPDGRLLLAVGDGEVAGCVALRRIGTLKN